MQRPIGDKQPPRQVSIGERHAGQRIDNFLCTYLKGIPKGHIYRILRRGEVRVNKGRVKQSYRLSRGDSVRIPPLRYEPSQQRHRASSHLLELLESSVVFEDANVLVLDKPSGLAVHGGSRTPHGVIEALREARPDAPFLELVHRLDRETSGCLLLAKRRSVLRYLHERLRARKVDKRYLVLVMGPWRGGARRVDMALRKNVLGSGERIVRLDAAGKPATTLLRPLVRSELASLLEVKTMSGRTHQIRAHGAALGHPVAGDSKYGNKGFNRTMRDYGLGRLFLHATSITYSDYDSGGEIRVAAPLPEELRAVMENLGLDFQTAVPRGAQ